MKTIKNLNKILFTLVLFSFLIGIGQSAHAACTAGSVTFRAPLHNVNYDPVTRVVTFLNKIGTVTKTAVLRSDCVSYTTYRIYGTSGLPYPDGTPLVMTGKTTYGVVPPTALAFPVNGGSADGAKTASGLYSGTRTDSCSLYIGDQMVARCKQPWS
jgi:hypothetical protein